MNLKFCFVFFSVKTHSSLSTNKKWIPVSLSGSVCLPRNPSKGEIPNQKLYLGCLGPQLTLYLTGFISSGLDWIGFLLKTATKHPEKPEHSTI